jgi:hypothetical protein
VSAAPATRTRRALLPLVGAAVIISALTTWYVLGPYFHSFNTPHTSLEGVPHAPSTVARAPGIARRLVLVIVDGVSFEAARAFPELAPLRRAGVLRPLRAEFPTFTSPALTSFVTGLSPRDSGTRLNGGLDGVRGLDSFLTAAGDARVPVRLRSREWEDFAKLMLPPPTADVHSGRIGLMTELVKPPLPKAARLPGIDGRSPTREVTFVYFGEIDEAAHYHGTRSREYAEAERVVGAVLTRIVDDLDLSQDSLIVVSDHGHRIEGGHGGEEPEVSSAFLLAAGGFLRRGVELSETRPTRDVAATLSVLAGVRVPASNLGLPMLDLLSLDDAETSLLLAAPFDQAAHFLCHLSPSARCDEIAPLVARLEKPDATAWEEATALHDALTRARDQALTSRGAQNTWQRLAITALALAMGAVALWLRRRSAALRRADMTDVPSWLTPWINVGVYSGLLSFAFDYRPTFSSLRAAPIFLRDAMLPGLAAAALVVAFAWFARPGRLAPWILLFSTSIAFLLLAAAVGCDPALLPHPIAGALVFLLGPAVLSAAIAAVVLALLPARRRGREAPAPG